MSHVRSAELILTGWGLTGRFNILAIGCLPEKVINHVSLIFACLFEISSVTCPSLSVNTADLLPEELFQMIKIRGLSSSQGFLQGVHKRLLRKCLLVGSQDGWSRSSCNLSSILLFVSFRSVLARLPLLHEVQTSLRLADFGQNVPLRERVMIQEFHPWLLWRVKDFTGGNNILNNSLKSFKSCGT